MPRLILHEDRSAIHALPLDLSERLKQLGLVESFKVSFCGMIYHQDAFHIFIPRNSQVKSMETTAITTIRAMERYASSSSGGQIMIDDADEGDRNLGILLLARSILEDYMANGLYVRRLKRHSLNEGKPDWARTINTQLPFIADDGNPVYADISTTVRYTSHENLITLIHAHVVRELGRLFSWWITGDMSIDIGRGLENIPLPNLTTNSLVDFLKRELGMIYSDRESRLFSNLIRYLENDSQVTEGNIVIGIRNFHHAWEEMLRQTLPDVTNMNSKLPKPAYTLKGNTNPIPSKSGMITDIILKREDSYTVVDAKYYAGTLDGAPGWGDMVKQFYYGISLARATTCQNIKNCFIFPGSDGPLETGVVFDPVARQTLEDEAFKPIRCLYFEPITVMEYYNSFRKFVPELVI